MSDSAKVKAARAASQARHAAKNSAEAVELVGEEAAEVVSEKAGRINPRMVSGGVGNAGQGLLALSVSAYAAIFAVNKLRRAAVQMKNAA